MELEGIEAIKAGLPNLHSAPTFLDELKSKEEIWLEKRRGKFTSSEDHRLMAGVDQTAEQAAVKLSAKAKADLEKQAAELNLDSTGTKIDIARRIVDFGIIPYGPNAFSEGGETYVLEKVIQELTDEDEPFFENAAMRWGKEWEATAVQEFERQTGIKVDNYGEDQVFVDHESEHLNKAIPVLLLHHIGGTPDGLIGSDCGIETKCPDSKQHLNYIMNIKDANTLKEVYPEAYWQIQSNIYKTGRSAWYFVSFDPRFKNPNLRILIVKVGRNNDDVAKLETRLKLAVQKKLEAVNTYSVEL